MIVPETWAAIRPVFARSYPLEAVVAVWADGTWQEFENRHRAPEGAFELDAKDTALLRDKPPHALIHSHCNGDPAPSDFDSLQQLATGWTWGVVAVDGDDFGNVFGVHFPVFWGAAVPRAPLIGRKYLWVVSDCFGLMRDYYAEQGIHFPDVPRVKDPSNYPAGHWAHRYFEHWTKELGFVPVERSERKLGDACVRRSGVSRHLDHCSVFLGNGKYLDISRDRPSHEFIPDSDESFMRVTGARFYRWKGRK